MGQVLHGSARTTAAIRRAIQRSEESVRALAAISHDLRTPITRLRLRAEFVDDTEQRVKMLNDLEQMEAMIAATLAFARDDSTDEPRRFSIWLSLCKAFAMTRPMLGATWITRARRGHSTAAGH